MELEPMSDAPPREAGARLLSIRFTGSGAEYFRIWIVNLLLLVVTLGFYWPWAKVRRLRYFMHNTLVDGDPLDFHADPKQMLKGWALVGVLFAMYNVASSASAVANLVAIAALAALWPALWWSAMRFRLGNTSWRGLRFRFTGSTADAYRALLPLLLMGLPAGVLGLWVPDDPEVVPPDWVAASFAGVGLFAVLMLPWLFWRMKAYQHRHYALAHLQTDFRASVRSFYGLGLKQSGLMMLLIAALMVVTALASLGADGGTGLDKLSIAHWIIGLLVLMVLGAMFLGMGPWWTTRLQNLVWNHTGNDQMQFVSGLRFRDMLWLSIKNGVLMALTLGLYWPFAAVATARLRLEAVQIRSGIDPDALLASAQENPAEAAGDAAGDFFGLDVGL
ncbi:YjgN family protein [Hydrogenophaga sp.]|uniref:YjgN family protein n=1 Tax=Hydrogenophaga sp. TaxID=1904254 RepID=UPI0035B080C2